MPSSPPANPRLAALLGTHRLTIADGLARLEWAADPGDPSRLVQDPVAVRPRVELFLDALTAGLDTGDWTMFAAATAMPTTAILQSGVRSVQSLNDRALAIVSVIIPHISAEPDRDELLVALFRTMQSLNGDIVASHHEYLREELRRLNEIKSVFLRATGHELRTPLTLVNGYASLLIDGDCGRLPEPADAAARKIRVAGDAAVSLVNGLTEVAALDDGAGVLQVAHARLAEMIQRAVADVRPDATARGVDIEQHVDDSSLEIDPERFILAVRNLIANAVKYGGPNTVVKVSATVNSSRTIEVTVEDEGPGVAPGDQDLIFDEYYRCAAARTSDIPGTGLGLYIVRRIAQLHGGDVRVFNGQAGGARFVLSVPAAR